MALRNVLLSTGLILARGVNHTEIGDCESLVQLEETKLAGDVYVSTAHSLEDLMYTAVLHRTMKDHHPMHNHIIQIRKDSPLSKRAHAIRVAMAQGWWNVQLEVFKPESLNMESVSLAAWRQYAPLSFRRESYHRVTYLSSDMVATTNFDRVIHKPYAFIAARNQGDCKNLTEALATTKPSNVVLSIVPDDGVLTWLTSSGTRLFSEGTMNSAPDAPLRKLDTAGVMSLAYEKMHPAMQSGAYTASEVMSLNCLMHHKDAALKERGADAASLIHLGAEGKKMIAEIIEKGENRLKNTISGLEAAGRKQMANALTLWFHAYNRVDVKGVLDAAKNGVLAEK